MVLCLRPVVSLHIGTIPAAEGSQARHRPLLDWSVSHQVNTRKHRSVQFISTVSLYVLN